MADPRPRRRGGDRRGTRASTRACARQGMMHGGVVR